MRLLPAILVAGLCAPVLLLSVNHAQEAPADPGRELMALIDPATGSGALTDPASVARVFAAAHAMSQSRSAIAAAAADPALELKLYASGKLGLGPQGNRVEVEVGTEGGKIKVPLSPVHAAALGVGDRSLSVSTEVQVLSFGTGPEARKCKLVHAIEAKYKNNEDMYAALPLPGFRQVQAITNHFLGKSDKPPETPEQAMGWDAREGFEKSARAGFEASVEEFKRSMGWVAPESIKVQSGVQYEGSGIDLASMHTIKFDFASPEKFYSSETRNSVTLKKSLSADGKWIEGSVEAGLIFSVGTGGLNEPVSAERLAFSEAYAKGDDERAAAVIASSLLPATSTDEMVEVIRQMKASGKEAFNLALDQVVNVVDPIGGVRLHFNPGFRGTGVSVGEYGRMLQQLAELRAQGAREFALQSASKLSGLVRVPLDEARAAQSDLGLTRICGFTVDAQGAISLVGRREPGRAPIPRDYLTVALTAIWRDNTAPFVSLDPDPGDFAGAQKVRVGGLPAGMERTAFVKTMIDADYLMKRLDLGDLRVNVGSYEPSYHLMETWPDAPAEVMSRMWLVPASAAVGDIYEHQDAEGLAVLFRAGVVVQSETLKRAGDTLIGAGESNPLNERAATSLTANYDALATLPECGDFHALQQVFDVAKLCAIWRARGMKHAVLDGVAARAPASVDYPDSYPGIGPVVLRGGTYHLSGGALSRVRVRQGGVHNLPALAALREGADSVELPQAINLAGRELSFVNSELLANASLVDVLAGRYRQALDGADRAVADDAANPLGLAVRGLAHFALGHAAEAQRDLAQASAIQPSLLALQAQVEACTGREAEALAACARAEKAAPNDADVLAVCGWARIYARDYEGAERVASRLLELSAFQSDGMSLRDTLGIIYRDTPPIAHKWVRQQRTMPLASRENIAAGRAALSGLDADAALECFRRAYDAAVENQAAAGAHTFTREFCQYLLATALKSATDFHSRTGDSDKAGELSDEAWALIGKLATEHPGWPSLDLVKCDLAGQRWTLLEAAQAFKAACTKDAAGDPIFAELAHALGAGGVRAIYGWSLLKNLRRYREADEEATRALVAILADQMGDTPEAELMRKLSLLSRGRPSRQEIIEVVAILEKFPATLPDDLGRVVWLNQLMAVIVSRLPEGDDETDKEMRERLLPLRTRFLRAFGVNGLPEGVLKQASMAYFEILASVQDEMRKEVKRDARYAELRTRVIDPAVTPLDWRRDVVALVGSHAGAKAEGLSEFAAGFLADPLTGRQIESELLDEAQAATWELGDETGAAARARLEVVREALKPTGDSPPFEEMAQLADKAANEVELNAVTTMIDIAVRATGIASGMADAETARESTKVMRAMTAMRARIQGRNFAGPRDWAAWRAKDTDPVPLAAAAAVAPAQAADPVKPAEAAEAAKSAETAEGPPWLWIALGAAVVVALVALLVVVKSRSHKAREA